MQVTTRQATHTACRIDLESAIPERRLPGRNRTKPDVLVLRLGDLRAAVKDYRPLPFPLRHTLGRWLVRREARAYEAARGAPGIPEFLGRLGPLALATRFVDAPPLARFLPDEVPAGTLDRLAEVVDGLHRRGVALGDLSHRDVLVAADGSVHVVDLATARCLGSKAGPLGRRLFEQHCKLDRVALERMRARLRWVDPDHVSLAESPSTARWHRYGRRLRSLVRRGLLRRG